MADSYTSNLNLTKPEVGSSADSWGAKLNADMDALDSVFNAGGNGTSVGLNVGSGKTLAVTGSVSGGVLATVTGAQTLTNKTISGSSNTISNVPLTSAVTGVLPIANGGTGSSLTPGANQLLIGNGSGYSLATITAGSNVSITNSGGNLTISSSAAPTGVTAVANGGTGLSSTPSAGQLLIGNGNGYSLNTINAGTGIAISNSAGGVTISSTVSGGTGTITGVTGTGTASGLTLSGSGTAGAVTLTLSGTVTAAAGSLSGSTLASNVTASSLTSLGNLSSLNVYGNSTITGTLNLAYLTVSGAATFSSTAAYSGNVTINAGAGLRMQTTNSSPGYGNGVVGGAWSTDASNGPGMFISRANYVNLVLNNNSDSSVIEFYKSGSIVGAIAVSTGTLTMPSSSDYRLKENIEPLTGAITRLQNMQVYRFNWKALPGGPKVDGFIAHEVQPIVPQAIWGEKDAVNDDGSIKPQGIDQSKLVPLLTAALQEAVGEINSLKTRVAALEAA